MAARKGSSLVARQNFSERVLVPAAKRLAGPAQEVVPPGQEDNPGQLHDHPGLVEEGPVRDAGAADARSGARPNSQATIIAGFMMIRKSLRSITWKVRVELGAGARPWCGRRTAAADRAAPPSRRSPPGCAGRAAGRSQVDAVMRSAPLSRAVAAAGRADPPAAARSRTPSGRARAACRPGRPRPSMKAGSTPSAGTRR